MTDTTAPAEPAEDAPTGITPGHLASIAIALSKAFGDDRDARLAWVNENLADGRVVESMKHLTDADYGLLIPLAKALPKHVHDSSPAPRRTAEEIQTATAPDGSTVVPVDELHPTEPLLNGFPVLDVPAGADLSEIAAGLTEQTWLRLAAGSYRFSGFKAPEEAPPVQEAVRRVMEAIGRIGVGKDGYNETQRYNFRGIDDFVNRLSPILSEHGVILLPNVGVPEVTEHATKGGGKQFMLVVRVKWRIVGPAGDSLKAVTLGQAMDTSDKAGNKAMSAAYKYALGQVFAIPNIGWAEGDNDHPEAVADAPAPTQPSNEEQEERYALLSRINARATEIGKTFEEFTSARRAQIAGGISVEEFRAGPISGLRGYIERVDAYLKQQAEDAAQRPIDDANNESDPGDDINPDEPNR